MTTPLTAGDTVRLKRPYARGLTKRSAGANKTDWVARRGIVRRIGVRGTACVVVWQGCIHPDHVPIGAVERCP